MKVRISIRAALTLTLFFATSLAADTLSLKQQAKNEAGRLRFRQAVALARQATVENPNDAEAWYLLGQNTHWLCYDTRPLSGFTRATSDSILSYFERAVALNPGYGDAYYYIGAEYGARYLLQALCRGDIGQARAELRTGRAKGGYPDWMLEYGRNLLKECAPNAILFLTNDPLENVVAYLQLVEHLRPDVSGIPGPPGSARAVLAAKQGFPGWVAPAPISWSREQIANMHDYGWSTDTLRIPLRTEVLRSMGIASRDTLFEWEVKPADFKGRHVITPYAAVLMDMLETNQWRRPIYFAPFWLPMGMDIDSCIQDCGLVQRLLPVRVARYGLELDTSAMKRVLMDSADYRDVATYKDHPMPRTSYVLWRYGNALMALAEHYIKSGDSVAYRAVVDRLAALGPPFFETAIPDFPERIAGLRRGPRSIERQSASRFAVDTIAPKRLTGRPFLLAPDDNSADGKESFAGPGGVRVFETPDTSRWYVVALSIHGRRFGPPASARDTFDVVLCDSEFGTITVWRRPYSAFAQDSSRWVRFEVPPTRVPRQFTLALHFHATDQKGIYISYDSSTHGHSFGITPGYRGQPFESGDWMIRVELDHAK